MVCGSQKKKKITILLLAMFKESGAMEMCPLLRGFSSGHLFSASYEYIVSIGPQP